MIEIIACKDRIDELVLFVARLNSDGVHHIGFFGEGEADVRASLEECLIPPAEGFVLAYEGDQLVGIFGADADSEISRAWLFGPIVEHANWLEVADLLYAKVLPRIPVDIREYELFCDKQNTNLETFALRHGFPLHSENAIMTLARGQYRPAARPHSLVVPYAHDHFEPFQRLHQELFPKAYFTARQIVERLDGERRLFLAVEHGQILGYHFCKIESASESGYIDFIGTAPAARGRGVGADLLAAGVDWMFSAPSTKKIHLTVNVENTAARRLYEQFGFLTERIMRGYRLQITME